MPKCVGTRLRRIVRSPRPSSARIACHTKGCRARSRGRSPRSPDRWQEPRHATVGRHARAVVSKPQTTRSPRPLRPRPQDGEAVVAARPRSRSVSAQPSHDPAIVDRKVRPRGGRRRRGRRGARPWGRVPRPSRPRGSPQGWGACARLRRGHRPKRCRSGIRAAPMTVPSRRIDHGVNLLPPPSTARTAAALHGTPSRASTVTNRVPSCRSSRDERHASVFRRARCGATARHRPAVLPGCPPRHRRRGLGAVPTGHPILDLDVPADVAVPGGGDDGERTVVVRAVSEGAAEPWPGFGGWSGRWGRGRRQILAQLAIGEQRRPRMMVRVIADGVLVGDPAGRRRVRLRPSTLDEEGRGDAGAGEHVEDPFGGAGRTP